MAKDLVAISELFNSTAHQLFRELAPLLCALFIATTKPT